MPTFDFANVIRKIVAGAVAAASSPTICITACAVILAAFADDITSFFTDSFTLPSFSLPQLNLGSSVDSELLNLLLYSVRSDLAVEFINSVLSFISSLFDFVIRFFASAILCLVTMGGYRAARSAIKDIAG